VAGDTWIAYTDKDTEGGWKWNRYDADEDSFETIADDGDGGGQWCRSHFTNWDSGRPSSGNKKEKGCAELETEGMAEG